MSFSGRVSVLAFAAQLCAVGGGDSSHAMCDVIPGVTAEFRGALGTLNRPFAIPGDQGQQIKLILKPLRCDGASPGFIDLAGGVVLEDDYFISIVFKPPNGGPRNAVVLTTATNEATCQSRAADAAPLLDGGAASCRVVEAGTQGLDVVDVNTVGFRFPDTDAELAPDDDDRTFTGPAVIAITRVADPPDPLPFGIDRCKSTAGLVACVDELYAANASCNTTASSLDPIFAHFTALPPANDYEALCETAGTECDGTSPELRFTVDERGNALIPVDWRGVLLRHDELPIARLVRGTVSLEAFTGGPVDPVRVPGSSFLASYAPGGQKLPPIFTPLVGADPGQVALYGTVDAPVGVIRVARRAADLSDFDPFTGIDLVYRQCSGGANDELPCVVASDCPGGACGAATCHLNQVDQATPCTNDTQCGSGEECGPALFDFSDRLVSGVGPVLVSQSDVALQVKEPAPLDGLRETRDLFAFVELEALATPADPGCPGGVGQQLNDDSDCTDAVVVLRDRITGTIEPIGSGGAQGRAVTRVRRPPFSFPAIAVEDDPASPSNDILALLEPEPLEGDCTSVASCDENSDGDAFDTILRTFRIGTPGELVGPPVADAEPVLNGRSVVVSDGKVFFRTSESEESTRVTIRPSETSLQIGDPGYPCAGTLGSEMGVIAAGGDFVAMTSLEPLVPGDANSFNVDCTSARTDIFVRDITPPIPTPPTVRANVSSAGSQAPSGSINQSPAISANGRYVAFASTTLYEAVPNPCCKQVWLRDLQSGTTELVSKSSANVRGNADSNSPAISDDGRYVAFGSFASNLTSLDPGGYSQIYVRDRTASLTFPVGGAFMGGGGNFACLSRNGRFVAFDHGTSVYMEDLDADGDGVFWHLEDDTPADGLPDTGEASIELVSGNPADGGASVSFLGRCISDDGRFVAFSSYATNLVPGDTNEAPDIFVRDRVAATLTRISVASIGVQGNERSDHPTISGDGRFVSFASFANNLATGGGDTNGEYDVFVADVATGYLRRESLDSQGDEGSNSADTSSITRDGARVAFLSQHDFDPTEGGDADVDVFVRKPGGATVVDRTGDGAADDTLLRVIDTNATPPLTVSDLCPADAVAVSSGRAAFLRPESAGATSNANCTGGALTGPDLNGDGDSVDSVAMLYDGSAVANLRCAAAAVGLSDSRMVALVSEGGQGVGSLNGDGDVADDVLFVRGVADAPVAACSPPSWINVGMAGETIAVSGEVVAVMTAEAAQGGSVLNGDGDATDRVLRLVNGSTGAVIPFLDDEGDPASPQAAEDFVLGGNLAAFRTRENAQGGADLNDDGDSLDDVLQIYDLVSGHLFNTGQAVTPCRLEACDPRTPYRVSGDTVTFLTLEADQGNEDLDGNGNAAGLVVQIFNARQAATLLAGGGGSFAAATASSAGVPVLNDVNSAMSESVTPLAGIGAGVCTSDAKPCATNADCSAGSCFLPPGGCIRDLGTACSCNATGCIGCGGGQFCVPNGFQVGTCHVNEGPCQSNGDCTAPAVCRDAAEDLLRIVAPLAPQSDGKQVFVAAATIVDTIGTLCTSDADCSPPETCNEAGHCQSPAKELVSVGAPDTDGDGIADPYDNCPLQDNPDQEADVADGAGIACPEPALLAGLVACVVLLRVIGRRRVKR